MKTSHFVELNHQECIFFLIQDVSNLKNPAILWITFIINVIIIFQVSTMLSEQALSWK